MRAKGFSYETVVSHAIEFLLVILFCLRSKACFNGHIPVLSTNQD